MIGHHLRPLLHKQRGLIAAAAAAMVGATVVSLAAPLLTKVVIDQGIRGHDLHAIDVVALIYVGLVLVRPLLERVVVLCSARAGERFLGDLRVAAYEKLQALSMPFFEQTRAGVLVSRLTNDVQTLTTNVHNTLRTAGIFAPGQNPDGGPGSPAARKTRTKWTTFSARRPFGTSGTPPTNCCVSIPARSVITGCPPPRIRRRASPLSRG